MKKNIAVIAGGYSGEYEISIQSASIICDNISSDLYNVYKIIVSKEHWKEEQSGAEIDKNDFSLTIEGQKIKFDLAFIIIHGTPGEDGKLQGYLDMVNVPYTSCNAVVAALSFNKVFCNKVVEGTDGVYVARSMHLYKHKSYAVQDILAQVNLPVFVKPAEGGSSLATFKIKEENELLGAVQKAFEVDPQVMAEEFIAGNELTMGVYMEKGEIKTLPITEIICTKEFFDFEAKYTPGLTEEVTPANISGKLTERIDSISKNLYHKLYCKGIVRFDYIYDKNQDKIYFLEVNAVPGQSENSIVPQQVRAAGLTLAQFYDTIINESL